MKDLLTRSVCEYRNKVHRVKSGAVETGPIILLGFENV